MRHFLQQQSFISAAPKKPSYHKPESSEYRAQATIPAALQVVTPSDSGLLESDLVLRCVSISSAGVLVGITYREHFSQLKLGSTFRAGLVHQLNHVVAARPNEPVVVDVVRSDFDVVVRRRQELPGEFDVDVFDAGAVDCPLPGYETRVVLFDAVGNDECDDRVGCVWEVGNLSGVDVEHGEKLGG